MGIDSRQSNRTSLGLWIFGIVVILTMFAAILTFAWSTQSLRAEMSRILADEEELAESRELIKSLEKRLVFLERNLTRPPGFNYDAARVPPDLLIYYDFAPNADIDTFSVQMYIPVPPQLSVEDKLRTIADHLSRFRFSGLPINVLSVKTRDGKRIAIVHLRETLSEYGATWRTGYFQGSTGGLMTSMVLVENLLQKDYEGEWVDGIEFYYEGELFVEGGWDHIDLSGVFYRD